MLLVVGATGQLGSAVVRKLALNDVPVRAFVRPDARYDHLVRFDGVDVAYGDLRDEGSVVRALDGVDGVVATANVVVPRAGDGYAAVEDEGYRRLIAACERAGVERFLFVSTPLTPADDRVAHLRCNRLTERRLFASGLNFTVVRAAPFMDVWLALLGSSIPLCGAESPTLRRRSRSLRAYRRLTGRLIETRGLALVPGSPDVRHSFVALDDVATFLVRCLDHPRAERATLEFGGPEAPSWAEVLDTYAAVLGRPVRGVYVPGPAFRIARRPLGLLSPSAAALSGLNRALGAAETVYDPDDSDAAAIVDWPRTSVERFLRERADLPGASASAIERRPHLGTGAS